MNIIYLLVIISIGRCSEVVILEFFICIHSKQILFFKNIGIEMVGNVLESNLIESSNALSEVYFDNYVFLPFTFGF